MFTRITPTLAVAYWSHTHSAQFGLQIPTRSPTCRPRRSRPMASLSTDRLNSE